VVWNDTRSFGQGKSGWHCKIDRWGRAFVSDDRNKSDVPKIGLSHSPPDAIQSMIEARASDTDLENIA